MAAVGFEKGEEGAATTMATEGPFVGCCQRQLSVPKRARRSPLAGGLRATGLAPAAAEPPSTFCLQQNTPTCQFRSLNPAVIVKGQLLRTGKLVPRVAAEKAALLDGLPMVLALQVRPEGDLARHLLRRGRVGARIPCARQAKPDDGSSRVEVIDTTSSLGPGEGMVGCGRSRQTRH